MQGLPRGRTYTGYSIGCAIAWALVLAARAKRGKREARRGLWLYCAGWWSGWLSAPIARSLYPPPGSRGPRRANAANVTDTASNP
jgi:hypothetical protein